MSFGRYAVLALVTSVVTASGCGALYTYPDATPERSAEACNDDIDNDVDGRADCDDPECARFCLEDTGALCTNGADDDQDGRADCKDSDCAEHCPEADADSCADGVDNDFDGNVDCEDRDCEGFCPEETQADCNDGLDNDGDGLKDDADPRCWLFLPPKVERCATTSGVVVFENFDVGLQSSRAVSAWRPYGVRKAGDLFLQVTNEGFRALERPGDRQDGLVSFDYNTTASNVLDSNLGALVRQKPFSGAWEGFELSFIADLPRGALLRAGIVPLALAPTLDPPLAGAETAQVAVTLDAAHWPPTIALAVENARTEGSLSLTRTLCGTTSSCDENFIHVRLALDDAGFVATASLPSGEVGEVRGSLPSSTHLPTSRLVFWGGSMDATQPSRLDDVRMSVQPEEPCGFSTPQIPGNACEYSGTYANFGRGVSVAYDGRDTYCALVTSSGDSESSTPEALTAWESSDGVDWAPAAPSQTRFTELLAGATLVGASVARHEADWRVAVAYRDGSNVRLGFGESSDCGAWEELEPGLLLFEDAEPPSYVIDGEHHEMYFTRPPTDESRRTLWRLDWREGQSVRRLAPELLAELPAGVDAPVSVTAVGGQDRVLTYPRADGFTPAGVGVLVADASRSTWSEVEPAPLLALPDGLESWQGRFSFDDRGAVSSALAWGPEGGFLVYGGISVDRSIFVTELALSVGTARLVPNTAELPSFEPVPRTECGDGSCDGNEVCESCPADCACDGVDLITDATDHEHAWQVLSEGLNAGRVQYLSGDDSGLAWAGGASTWSALPLGQVAAGDFDLSFDAYVSEVDSTGSCFAYVGLGSPADRASNSAGVAPSSGIFAELGYSRYCDTEYRLAPFVIREGAVFTTPAESVADRCSLPEALPVERWQHVVLRKRASRVTVLTPARNGCGLVERGVSYSGAVPDLSVLLVGFGGGPFGDCVQNGGSGSIANLRLHMRADPESCQGLQCAGAPSICVDPLTNPEHCGSCDNACAPHETCTDGRCVCSDVPGVLACDGRCVDSLTSLENCGTCGNACVRTCSNGRCDMVAGDCASPKVIPPGALASPLDFSEQPETIVGLCSGVVGYSLLVTSWIAPTSGRITIQTDVTGTTLNTVLAVTADQQCRAWTACNDDAPGLGSGSRVQITVTAGVTYRIAVALHGGNPSFEKPALKISYE